MNRLHSIVLFFIICTALTAQENASQIFEKATSQLITTNMELGIEINETRKNGRTTEKQFNVLMGKFDTTEKIKTQIIKPERASGVTIVLTQYPEKEGLIEIFTPVNGKTRKMKATPKNIELVGSGSLISNYTSKHHTELNFKLLTDTQFQNKACYQIEVSDKLDSKNGKAEFLIDKSNYRILQIISYASNETKESTTVLSGYKTVNNKIHPEIITTKNHKNNSSTEIKIHSIKLLLNINEDDFKLNTEGK